MPVERPGACGRTRVICHMMTSLDGRIVTEGWPLVPEGRREYEQIHGDYAPDGWSCGRVTVEQPFAQGTRSDAEIAREHRGPARDDFRAPGDHDNFAFAVDGRGKVAWATNDLDGEHVVALLSERVSDDYLASLRKQGVSYILAAARDVGLGLALEKISSLFGVRTLMLEGGGSINGSMLRAGLIDEVSVLVTPVVDGRADDVLWLRYRVMSR